MKLELGTQIARLRRERGWTQEHVAAAVGVSAPAVSKWESGGSYPDIELLSPLARLFGVRIDDLLGFDPSPDEETVKRLAHACAAAFKTQPYAAARGQCEEVLRTYPSCPPVFYQIGQVLWKTLPRAPNDDAAQEQLARSIEVMNWAAESDDAAAPDARAALCALYVLAGEPDKAQAAVDALPPITLDPRSLAPTLALMRGDLDAAQALNQENLLEHLHGAAMALFSLANIASRAGDSARALTLTAAHRTLIEHFGLSPLMLQNGQLSLALYSRAREWDAFLQAALRYADELSTIAREGWTPPPPFFDRSPRIKDRTLDVCDFTRFLLEDPAYAPVWETPQWLEIKRRLHDFLR